MKKIKVSEATNRQRDWLVAKCEGYFDATGQAPGYWESPSGVKHFLAMREPNDPDLEGVGWTLYTTNPAAMEPIIERERISCHPVYISGVSESGKEVAIPNGWVCFHTPRLSWQSVRFRQAGPTLLIAAARCFVVSRLGEITEVPNDL